MLQVTKAVMMVVLEEEVQPSLNVQMAVLNMLIVQVLALMMLIVLEVV